MPTGKGLALIACLCGLTECTYATLGRGTSEPAVAADGYAAG